jgi:hypothetical protein
MKQNIKTNPRRLMLRCGGAIALPPDGLRFLEKNKKQNHVPLPPA